MLRSHNLSQRSPPHLWADRATEPWSRFDPRSRTPGAGVVLHWQCRGYMLLSTQRHKQKHPHRHFRASGGVRGGQAGRQLSIVRPFWALVGVSVCVGLEARGAVVL